MQKCGNAEEAGAQVTIVCVENGKLGRHFGSWEQIDDTRRVFRKVQEEDRVLTVDLAETFFSH